ncbi:MAG: immune inhibitor A [Chloroflexi bacterium]|nr:immune inhibitor A [Chloroflexota bacterium]
MAPGRRNLSPVIIPALLTLMALIASCTASDGGERAIEATRVTSPVATPSATASPTASATAAPTASAVSTPRIALPDLAPDPLIGIIPVPPERDLYELARRLTLHSTGPVPRFASPVPPELQQGDRLSWRVSRDEGHVTVNSEVRLVSEHAYWVFEDGSAPDQGRLQQAAIEFESTIWPSVSTTLGDVWSPGVDGDPRIVIFHGRLRSGVAGYFSGIDEYPVQVQPDSNQREVIYISSDSLTLGGAGYLSTIAHELQHAIHWAADESEESWVNEGMSEVASGLAGFPPGSIASFLRKPNTSLVQWEPEIFDASPNYGAAGLFFEYIYAHYGGGETLRAIVEHPADGIDSIDAVMSESGYGATAAGIFADWVVANYVDDPSGAFSYPDRDTNRPRTASVQLPETVSDSVRPFGTNYYTLQEADGEIAIGFRGEPAGRVFPAEPHSGETCWWTNAGDSIDTTLTRAVDLRDVETASFEFWAWYSIEEDWDYAYVTVSTDGGSTWEISLTDRSSLRNPNGTAFGPGLTGDSASGGENWVRDVADLTRFAGSEILLRLEYITDDAIHGRGACFDDFAIAEIGWADDSTDSGGWTSDGFALINDRRPVEYLVQVIRDASGGESAVERLPVASDGTMQVTVRGPESGEQVIVAVSVISTDVSGSLSYAISFADRQGLSGPDAAAPAGPGAS